MENKKMLNIVICMVLALVQIGGLAFMYSTLDMPNNSNKTEEKEEEKLSYGSVFAVMLEKTKGAGDYEENTSATFPTSGYNFNQAKSGCVDTAGKKITGTDVITFASGRAKISVDTSAFCFLYFDKQ